MKKIYIFIAGAFLATQSHAQNGQIQNGGFENWQNSAIYDYTSQWGCSNTNEYRGVATTLKSTDAQLGTYSAELIAAEIGSMPDTSFGYVFHGIVGGSGPESGISYNSAFNTVKFQYKCDIPAGEAANILIIRYTMGVAGTPLLLPAATGTHSSWTQGSVSVPAGTQTELFIGFILGDPFSTPRPTPGSWFRVDNVQMYNGVTATTNLPDPSFESWATQTTEIPNNWYTMNELLAGISMENVNKSTNSYNGTYAAEISTVQYPPVDGDTISGIVSVGPIDFNNGSNPFNAIPYNASPTTFSGAYNYSSANMDQGSIQVVFFAMGVPVGSASQTFNQTMGYSTFNLPIMLSGTPDSMLLIAFSGDHPGSVLLLDDLSLSGGNVGLEEFSKFNVSLYPNPASENVMIKAEGTYNYELIDLSGNVISTSTGLNGPQMIDVSTISRGSYLIRLTNEVSSEILPLVVE
jgi:hypothetical protein